jgi:hypothetical protein
VVLHENEVGFNLVVMKGRAVEPTLHISAHCRSTANLILNARSAGLVPIGDDSDVTPKISFVTITLRTTASSGGRAKQGAESAGNIVTQPPPWASPG